MTYEPTVRALSLAGAGRPGRVGTWWPTTDAAGVPRGALQIDPAVVAGGPASERLSARIAAVRELNLPGVLGVVDLLTVDSRIWLITAGPASPTVAQLLTGAGQLQHLDVAALAVRAGRTLVALHAAGLAHGALGPDAVLADGTLIEVGVMKPRPDAVAVDVRAWCDLARLLADRGQGPSAEALRRTVAAAESDGLAAAVAGPAESPSTGTEETMRFERPMDRTVRIAAAASLPNEPTAVLAPPVPPVAPLPAPPTVPAGQPAEATVRTPPAGAEPTVRVARPAAGEATAPVVDSERTMRIDAPVASEQTVRIDRQMPSHDGRPAPVYIDPLAREDTQPALGATSLDDTRPGTRHQAVPAAPDAPVRLRFGSGVTPEVAEVWKTSGQQRKPRRRWRSVLVAVLTVAMVAGVLGYLWWDRTHPMTATAADVSPQPAPGDACDVNVDVVGWIHTNGRRGAVTYQWLRNDGEATEPLTQTVPSGTESVAVHLHWKFSGKGTFDAKATLKTLSPNASEATGAFSYNCQ